MITLKFALSLPIDRWGEIWSRTGKTPFPHKTWELMVYRVPDIIFFEFSLTTKRDHAGLDLDFSLFGYNIEFQVYDNRHWNDEENRWEEYV